MATSRTVWIFRAVTWAAVAVLVLAVAAIWLVERVAPPTQAKPYATAFSLTDQNGRTVSEANFLGRPSAWFFGFTHCPDVCPTALAEISTVLQQLGPDAERLQVVFVSVDPERDTPDVIKEYVGYFDPRIVGLTGTLDAVRSMAKARYIHSKKLPAEDGNYDMQHTAGIQLVAADGSFIGTLDSHEPFETRMQKIRRLIRQD